MSNVIRFDGVTKVEIPVEQVLDETIGQDLSGVVVIGYDQDGDFYFASSYSDSPEILWLLEQCKKFLLENSEK